MVNHKIRSIPGAFSLRRWFGFVFAFVPLNARRRKLPSDSAYTALVNPTDKIVQIIIDR